MLSGKSLCGKNGAFTPLLKSFIEKALEAEMDGYLDESERSKGNKRNGKGKKSLMTGIGTFDKETPADRHSTFEPELVKKRQTILADNLSEKIIGLYGLGMSLRDISSHVKEIYAQPSNSCFRSPYILKKQQIKKSKKPLRIKLLI